MARDATHATMIHAKAATKNVAASPETLRDADEGEGSEDADEEEEADRDSGRWYPVAAWKRGGDVHVRGTLGVLWG